MVQSGRASSASAYHIIRRSPVQLPRQTVTRDLIHWRRSRLPVAQRHESRHSSNISSMNRSVPTSGPCQAYYISDKLLRSERSSLLCLLRRPVSYTHLRAHETPEHLV